MCGLCLAHCWVLRQQDLFAAMQGGTLVFLLFLLLVSVPVFVWGWGWLMGLLFENYIVDASI